MTHRYSRARWPLGDGRDRSVHHRAVGSLDLTQSTQDSGPPCAVQTTEMYGGQ